jgi:hypothetical protein
MAGAYVFAALASRGLARHRDQQQEQLEAGIRRYEVGEQR